MFCAFSQQKPLPSCLSLNSPFLALNFSPSSACSRGSRTSLLFLCHQFPFSAGSFPRAVAFLSLKKAFFDFTSFSYCPFLYLLKNFQSLLSLLPLLNPSSQTCPHHSDERLVVTFMSLNLVVTALSSWYWLRQYHGTAAHTLFCDILFFPWLLGHIFLFFHLTGSSF